MSCPVGAQSGVVRRQRGHRRGQDDAARRRCSVSDPGDRILVVEDVREVRSAPPPRRAPGGPAAQRRGGRRGHHGRPCAPGLADAAGSAGRRRGARGRGPRAVGCPQHRPRRRGGTLHANAPVMSSPGSKRSGHLPVCRPPAVHAQLASAVSVVVHMRRNGVGRCVDAIGVVMGVAGARPVVVPVLEHHGVGSRLGDGDGDRDGVGEVAWDASAAAGAAVVGCDRVAGRARLAALVGSDVLP
jgi:hypothetical protein